MTAFLSISFFSGCSKDPALFAEADAIYFGTADTSISYSFAKYPKKLKDTINVPVNVLGNSAATDRSFSVEILPSANNAAIEGTHFKLLTNLIIPAKSVMGMLPVVVYRTADLENGKQVKINLKLKKDQNFAAEGITTKQKITINLGYMQKPDSWGEFTGTVTGFFAGYQTNFGTWSPTKYKVILDALYDPATGVTITEFPGSRFSPPVAYNLYLATVRNYIKTNYPGNYGLPGAVLNDPDNGNKPIQVGPANY
ncbi:DUF4843 domain-containing protein [Pedobacter sp. HDW13]|uniref:DUF4843 domain-containing protein n=1 Tax=unclassified Pedobacter TaxID=2628915 RepID=UPI00131A0655|nr:MULTISPECIES: DUF4843 domain-containing protein [unclassified Pedobacter]QIL40509.1 DUF4843 domain-containing protein [Pedobacter sp. HDW13]